jgi:hypothetical protein
MKGIYNGGRPIDYRENQQVYESARHLTWWWAPQIDRNNETPDVSDSFGRPIKQKHVGGFPWADAMHNQQNITLADDLIISSPWVDL